MTRRLNRNIANVAAPTILRERAQMIGAAAAQVLSVFACVAPAQASSHAHCSATDVARHAAGAA
ncbi:hypothetical protein [Burkholderia cepacia]|uniref:Uncharacterized protein n=1 Tax=Burkholderia cepacia GG4 TaxID=1009846 RepID=A0A9W3PBB3_BURCE|nr:hypothetical protein [Burkholderia cepacia]AFQ50401.1 hypothetical protein GEM_4011 [Burkholderia cepacia GG4]